MTRILTRDDVARLLTPDDCLTAVETVFRALGEAQIPPPQSLGLRSDEGTFHIKAAVGEHFVAKVNANFPANPSARGLPTIQGVLVLMDVSDGTLLAIIDSALLTALRTAAATAVAAKYLARVDARTLAIIGCGMQAGPHVDAVCGVRPIDAVHVFDVDRERAVRFAGETSARTGLAVTVTTSLDQAIASADIIVTATPSRRPVLDIQHLRDGLFIAGVGADNPQKHELSPALLRQSRVVPDVLDHAAAMGDLHHALAAGVMERADIHGELKDVVCGHVPGRRTEKEIFLFDSVGNALQDVAVASVAYRRAIERGMGLDVALQ